MALKKSRLSELLQSGKCKGNAKEGSQDEQRPTRSAKNRQNARREVFFCSRARLSRATFLTRTRLSPRTENAPGTQIALVSSPLQSLICQTAGSRRNHARESSVRDEPDANITEMAGLIDDESGLFVVVVGG